MKILSNLAQKIKQSKINQISFKHQLTTPYLQKNFCLSTLSKKDLLQVQEIQNKIKDHKRVCHIPETKLVQVNQEINLKSSKFCGAPFIFKDEKYPECDFCQTKLNLLLQLNTNELPEKAKEIPSDSLIQLLYCVNEQCSNIASHDPFTFGSVKRRLIHITANQQANHEELNQTDFTKMFEEKQIIKWNQKDDYPHSEELFELLTQDEAILIGKYFPVLGDKYLGHPFWVQQEELPNCTTCGIGMKYLFQLDSNKNVPYMFGDFGTGIVHYCPVHPDILSFSWQSQ